MSIFRWWDIICYVVQVLWYQLCRMPWAGRWAGRSKEATWSSRSKTGRLIQHKLRSKCWPHAVPASAWALARARGRWRATSRPWAPGAGALDRSPRRRLLRACLRGTPGLFKMRTRRSIEPGRLCHAEITSQLLPELNAWPAQALPRESGPKDGSILGKIE